MYIPTERDPEPDFELPELEVQNATYTEMDVLFPPINNTDDEIALQDDRLNPLTLMVLPPFVDDVELGAVIGTDQTFAVATLIIQDDDSMYLTPSSSPC